METVETSLRRTGLLKQKKSLQDYMVTPKQTWLDGIISSDGRICQILAAPPGLDYSIKAQITTRDLLGGLQIGIMPAEPFVFTNEAGDIFPVKNIFVHVSAENVSKNLKLHVKGSTSIDDLKYVVQVVEGILSNQQHIIDAGKTLQYCGSPPLMTQIGMVAYTN